ncbi:MAG: hypothetical protein SFY67_03670 [Candidatus Melainabacteria bacterium]|nr:hypothetical protein [Candidatus Melainabacteria bacterium]
MAKKIRSNNALTASLLALAIISSNILPALAASQKAGESGANTQEIPTQILKTGVSLNASTIAPNSMQLSDNIGLTPVLERIQTLKANANQDPSARQDLFEAKQEASFIIQKANLDIDFTVAAIMAEREVYQEILATFISERDKTVARVNAASFISNGILWTVCEALAIGSINTTYARNPKKCLNLTIPSGVVGIAAGLVPSIASMYTLKAVNGKKKTSEAEPNMLAKLFNYPTNPDIEYPKSVWQYLHQVPASEPNAKSRLEQIIDRWIADSNMAEFTDRTSKKQLDVLTASVSQKKGLSIATLTSRTVMLQQLQAEVLKMKRLLLELNMVAQGEKQLVAQSTDLPRLR